MTAQFLRSNKTVMFEKGLESKAAQSAETRRAAGRFKQTRDVFLSILDEDMGKWTTAHRAFFLQEMMRASGL